MTKQKWPYKLTLSPDGTRWVKKHEQKQYYFPIPVEIRGNVKRLESHCRHVWKHDWLPKLAKLTEESDKREKEAIRSRWENLQPRITRYLGVARSWESKEVFVENLLSLMIAEYELQTGIGLGREKRLDIMAAPQDYPDVFGFEPIPGTSEYQLPAKRAEAGNILDSETTIEALIARFLTEKKPEVSYRRWKILRGNLADFAQHVGNVEFDAITEDTLRAYRVRILARITAGAYGDMRGSDLLDSAKQFIRWAMSQSKLVALIDPVVASSIHSLLSAKKTLTIQKSVKAVKTSPVETIQSFLAS